jgi:serine/threonine protein kinase
MPLQSSSSTQSQSQSQSQSQVSGTNRSLGGGSSSDGSKQSRTSGYRSSTRGSGTRNSGTAGSDDAVGDVGGGGLGASLAAHHRDHRQQNHRQQNHRQQHYQQQQQQHGMAPQHQQYHQQHQQHQQHYSPPQQQQSQQSQHYNNNSQPQQQQQQYLQQQYEQQHQYELQQQYEQQQQQQQLQQQYEQQQLQQEAQQYHGGGNFTSYGSQQSQYSQQSQSQSQSSYYVDYQSQGAGAGAGGTAQSHFSSIIGSVTGSQTHQSQAHHSQTHQSHAAQSQASSTRSAAVDEAYRRLGQKLSRSVHGDDVSLASSARGGGQPHNRIGHQQAHHQQHHHHPVRIGISVNNPSSVFVSYNIGAAEQEKERKQHEAIISEDASSNKIKGNVVRKMTANANDLFRLWHTEYQRTNHNNANKSNVKEQQQQQQQQRRRQSNQNHDRDVSPNRRAFAQMTLAGDGSSTKNNNTNNNTGGGARNNNSSSHHHISSHSHNHNLNNHNHNHNSIYHQQHRGSLSAVIESDSCTNKRSSSDSSNGNTRTTNQRSLQSGGGTADGGKGDNDNSIIASSIATRTSSIGTRSCNTLPPPRGKCLTQPSEGVSGTNYNLCDNTEGNLIVYENDTLSVSRKHVHALKNKTNTNGSDGASKIRHGSGRPAAYTDFRVQSLLGQGTFAQVFKCLNSQTGKFVAVKIVKAKPAYTRQAAIEIDVIRALTTSTSSSSNDGSSSNTDYMVDMVCYFMYKDHLCLVFELLGMNLYEVLKKRQFRGLPLGVVQTMVRQAVLGARALGQKSIVHCDLKPENILLVNEDDAELIMSAGESKRTTIPVDEMGKTAAATKTTIAGNSDGNDDASLSTITTTPQETTSPARVVQKIKLIDFGSACFEGQMSHTYIQSRFYRSPEVLIGLAYDSAIDMWSLGCVAAELFLGLPILPGVHEHNQLGRISEMIGDTPDWMLDQGSKTSKYFVKFVPAPTPTPPSTNPRSPSPIPLDSRPGSQPPRPLPQWRIKTQQEYIASLSQSDIKKKGGLNKLEKLPGNRYFKRSRLSDIVLDKGQSGKQEDVRLLQSFVHFLYGM